MGVCGRTWFGLFGIALMMGWVFAADQGDPSARIGDIGRHLSSDDFAVRESAQRDLDALPNDMVQPLRNAANAEADPEAKARLFARVEQMEIDTLLHPFPISMDVQNATLEQIVGSLNGTLGDDLLSARPGRTGERFTLKAQKQPFWQVMLQLNEQHDLAFGPGTGNFSIAPGDWKTRYAVNGAFAAYASITQVMPRGRAGIGVGAGGLTSIHVVTFVDPRIKIHQAMPHLQVTALVDQAGKSLLSSIRAAAQTLEPLPAGQNCWLSSVDITLPADRTIARVAFTQSVVITSSAKTVTLENISQSLKRPRQAGTVMITVDSISINGGDVDVTLGNITPAAVASALVLGDGKVESVSGKAEVPNVGVQAAMLPTLIHVVDQDDRVLVAINPTFTIGQAMRVRVPGGAAAKSLKLQVVVPSRAVMVQVPLEIREFSQIGVVPSFAPAFGTAPRRGIR